MKATVAGKDFSPPTLPPSLRVTGLGNRLLFIEAAHMFKDQSSLRVSACGWLTPLHK